MSDCDDTGECEYDPQCEFYAQNCRHDPQEQARVRAAAASPDPRSDNFT